MTMPTFEPVWWHKRFSEFDNIFYTPTESQPVGCVPLFTAEQLQQAYEAGQQAITNQGSWDGFASYLLDICEGEQITEEMLQVWASKYFKNPQYCKQAPSAAPDIDDLAQFIRKINGRNLMGAATLAENIIEWLGKLPSAAPKGWQLVPIEPTEAMCIAGDISYQANVDNGTDGGITLIYKAMLAAAPEATK